MSDLSKFYKKFKKFNYLIGVYLAELFQSYLTEEYREFPNTTTRKYGRGKTGKIATTPRDVIDTGNLYNSFVWYSYVRGNLYTNNFGYEIEYAIDIYMGYTSNNRKIPSFPWINMAIRTVNWDKVLPELWKQT